MEYVETKEVQAEVQRFEGDKANIDTCDWIPSCHTLFRVPDYPLSAFTRFASVARVPTLLALSPGLTSSLLTNQGVLGKPFTSVTC